MRIKSIEITNYRVFLGVREIKAGCKNLFIYGENGSGKSSLYYALKDFFQSSIEDINISEWENAFLPESDKNTAKIKVKFSPSHKGKATYTWDSINNDTRLPSNTSIQDGNKLKSFLTYKHLLNVYHLKKDESINLFDLLVKGVLKHFKYSLTKGKELGVLWEDIEALISKPTGRNYPADQKKREVDAAIKEFNTIFGELFKKEGPEYILKHTNPILNRFNHNIDLELRFPQVRPNSEYTSLEGKEVRVDIEYAGKKIDKPHLLLNEARLSAIAISIYLGMIKRHIQLIPCKVLFLDDIFIGLDIANRLPLLEVLEDEFSDYQIFITTYDKPWFEYVRGSLEQKSNWKTLEFYAQPCKDGTEIPLIFDGSDLIAKAEQHLRRCDYKAAAVYARSAFEKLIRKHCMGKPVAFMPRFKGYKAEHFWKAIKGDLSEQIKNDIETYRTLVLNPFSHYDTEQHEIRAELANAIEVIKRLKAELSE